MMKRWKLSDAQRADMWTRWKAGQSLHPAYRYVWSAAELQAKNARWQIWSAQMYSAFGGVFDSGP